MKLIKDLEKRPVGRKNSLQWYALFECEYCERQVEKLKSNGKKQKSCGCHTGTHGMAHTRIYKIWSDMKKRCDNPNTKHYSRYGGRGITYQSSWVAFEAFYTDMLEGYSDTMTIDRKDVDEDYTKNNCQWLSNSINAGKDHRNRKQSDEWVAKRTSKRIQVTERLLTAIIKEAVDKSLVIKTYLLPKYGVSLEAFRNAMRRYGVTVPTTLLHGKRVSSKRTDPELIENIRQAVSNGSTVIAACHHFGINKTTYYNNIKEQP